LAAFLIAFFVASRAGTFVSQIRKVVMAGVAVGPRDVYSSVIRNMNFDAGRLFALIDGNGHWKINSY
jgi:hypothetical protein